MFYKICQYCGYLNSSQNMIKVCANPECSMPIHEGRSFTEKEYLQLKETKKSNPENMTLAEAQLYSCSSEFLLVNEDGMHIPIPNGKVIVGRAALGKDELKDLLSISREHLEVESFKDYIKIKDISKFGSMLNGKILQKGEWEFAFKGDILTLATHSFKIEKENSR